jgi:thiosulfate/3-mercaptopyruvate sulfurtransferase
MSQWGLNGNSSVVVYDDMGGGIATRMWWLLGACGLEHVAVLNGGFVNWQSGGFPTESTEGESEGAAVSERLKPGVCADTDYHLPVVSTQDIVRVLGSPEWTILDARAAERYRGIHEPIDPVAGHIPGAESLPWMENLDEEGRFLKPSLLRERFRRFLGDDSVDRTICYCGSGVTATHNILAIRVAGYDYPALYPGSWSEWIVDPERPITGDPE